MPPTTQLAIDLGNTFAKAAWFEGGELVAAQHKIGFEDLNQILLSRPTQYAILSSTSHKTQPWADWLADRGCRCFQLNATLPVPIQKDYLTPETLGADRVAAAVGSQVMFRGQNCIVIDVGTCATYDWVSGAGVFEGGIISPGLRMRFNAMHTFTKRLPLIEVEKDRFPTLVGKSTRHAMLSGVINGMLAEINGIIERYMSEKGAANVLVCGGDATYFDSRLKYPNFVAPNLVLVGLNRILDHNVTLLQNT